MENSFFGGILIGVLGTILAAILTWLYRVIIRRINKYRASKIRDSIPSTFSEAEINQAFHFYVLLRVQSTNPVAESQAEGDFQQSETTFLLEHTIAEHIQKGVKVIFLVAGTGMGKTTAMIRLYARLRKQWKRDEEKVQIFPFNLAEKVAEDFPTPIKQSGLVLLLDGLDEDPKAFGDYRERLYNVLEKFANARSIVISVRTQFFESVEDEPFRDSPLPYSLTVEKFYISPFTEKEVRAFLRKRFGWFRRKRRKKAEAIIFNQEKKNSVLGRPMLLSFID